MVDRGGLENRWVTSPGGSNPPFSEFLQYFTANIEFHLILLNKYKAEFDNYNEKLLNKTVEILQFIKYFPFYIFNFLIKLGEVPERPKGTVC